MPTYTYAQYKSDVNGKIKGKIGILINPRSTLNQAARQSFSAVDLRSSRRKVALTPNLFSGPNEYSCPNDLKAYGIITVEPQVLAQQRKDWSLVPYEQFARRLDCNTIAVGDNDFMRKLYMNTTVNDSKTILANLDSINSGGGTWQLYGDALNVAVDQDNYIEGNGALKFDISAAGGSTAGIKNLALSTSDITAYLQGNGTLIVFAYIVSTVGLTNYILELGSDSSNFYRKTVTSQFDGTAFQSGWNVLEFDLKSLASMGISVSTSIKYSALYMTKSGTKISETGYKFDYMVLRRGNVNNIVYYSKYPWQTKTGVYIENSTADSDLLNVDTDEYDLLVLKGAELAAEEVDEEAEKSSVYRGSVSFNPRFEKFRQLSKDYQMRNPSEALTMITTTVDFVKV